MQGPVSTPGTSRQTVLPETGRASERPGEIGGEEENACLRVRANEIAAVTGAEARQSPGPDRKPIVAIEHLRSEQNLRALEARHAGRVGEYGRGILRPRAPTGRIRFRSIFHGLKSSVCRA